MTFEYMFTHDLIISQGCAQGDGELFREDSTNDYMSPVNYELKLLEYQMAG